MRIPIFCNYLIILKPLFQANFYFYIKVFNCRLQRYNTWGNIFPINVTILRSSSVWLLRVHTRNGLIIPLKYVIACRCGETARRTRTRGRERGQVAGHEWEREGPRGSERDAPPGESGSHPRSKLVLCYSSSPSNTINILAVCQTTIPLVPRYLYMKENYIQPVSQSLQEAKNFQFNSER